MLRIWPSFQASKEFSLKPYINRLRLHEYCIFDLPETKKVMKVITRRFLVLALFVAMGCYEEPAIKSDVEAETFYVKKIEVSKDQKLLDILRQISNKSETSGRIAQTDFGEILIDEALKLNQPADSTVALFLDDVPI